MATSKAISRVLAPTGHSLIFESELMWMGLAWTLDAKVLASCFGRRTPLKAWNDLNASVADWELDEASPSHVPSSIQQLVEDLLDYAKGMQPGDFRHVPLELSDRTPFQNKVTRVCQEIPPGETASYGEVAERAGSPRAARAVGAVMRSNRLPLIVPCHRVVASGGGLGGFSAPDGLNMKRRLLKLESEGRVDSV